MSSEDDKLIAEAARALREVGHDELAAKLTGEQPAPDPEPQETIPRSVGVPLLTPTPVSPAEAAERRAAAGWATELNRRNDAQWSSGGGLLETDDPTGA